MSLAKALLANYHPTQLDLHEKAMIGQSAVAVGG